MAPVCKIILTTYLSVVSSVVKWRRPITWYVHDSVSMICKCCAAANPAQTKCKQFKPAPVANQHHFSMELMCTTLHHPTISLSFHSSICSSPSRRPAPPRPPKATHLRRRSSLVRPRTVYEDVSCRPLARLLYTWKKGREGVKHRKWL